MTIEELHAEMVARFAKVERKLEASFRAEMKREGQAIRTHFDVMVDKMQGSVKLVAEATAHHAVRLEGHETRIKRLEGTRRR